ncbi:tail tape measure protein [uncultured Sphingomonas sp.]|uniref:tail tape measure protein n=1 Tax=uncultured Sphingomonas sp. TaxID=158754 RepID=UPI0025DD7EF2|nr:tail tape measure protein [uncultured Sphingomonas sp.]
MDEEIERLVVSVRADTAAFARDVADMRASLDGPMEAGAARAGRAVEAGLLRAVQTGKLGFEDLRRVALSVLGEIAETALKAGIAAIGGGRGGGLGAVLAGAFGLPGRATGGPVSPGAAYLVGERGPELFVPTSSGQVVADAGSRSGTRDVRVSITIAAPPGAAGGDAPAMLARSGRQVARAVRAALEGMD